MATLSAWLSATWFAVARSVELSVSERIEGAMMGALLDPQVRPNLKQKNLVPVSGDSWEFGEIFMELLEVEFLLKKCRC